MSTIYKKIIADIGKRYKIFHNGNSGKGDNNGRDEKEGYDGSKSSV
jgi:hypothetical protein